MNCGRDSRPVETFARAAMRLVKRPTVMFLASGTPVWTPRDCSSDNNNNNTNTVSNGSSGNGSGNSNSNSNSNNNSSSIGTETGKSASRRLVELSMDDKPLLTKKLQLVADASKIMDNMNFLKPFDKSSSYSKLLHKYYPGTLLSFLMQ